MSRFMFWIMALVIAVLFGVIAILSALFSGTSGPILAAWFFGGMVCGAFIFVIGAGLLWVLSLILGR